MKIEDFMLHANVLRQLGVQHVRLDGIGQVSEVTFFPAEVHIPAEQLRQFIEEDVPTPDDLRAEMLAVETDPELPEKEKTLRLQKLRDRLFYGSS